MQRRSVEKRQRIVGLLFKRRKCRWKLRGGQVKCQTLDQKERGMQEANASRARAIFNHSFLFHVGVGLKTCISRRNACTAQRPVAILADNQKVVGQNRVETSPTSIHSVSSHVIPVHKWWNRARYLLFSIKALALFAQNYKRPR